ncbi:prolyl oligopeptidase family serine peptidase [Caulobacter segnis]
MMKKGTKLDGSAPLLLYGFHGSYWHRHGAQLLDPQFQPGRSRLDLGHGLPARRLGKGWGWFLDGKKFKKKNTFTDFVACAEHLHAAGYGKPANTVAYGGSAGGAP